MLRYLLTPTSGYLTESLLLLQRHRAGLMWNLQWEEEKYSALHVQAQIWMSIGREPASQSMPILPFAHFFGFCYAHIFPSLCMCIGLLQHMVRYVLTIS